VFFSYRLHAITQNSILIKENTAINSVEFSPVAPHDFVFTSGMRVHLYVMCSPHLHPPFRPCTLNANACLLPAPDEFPPAPAHDIPGTTAVERLWAMYLSLFFLVVWLFGCLVACFVCV